MTSECNVTYYPFPDNIEDKEYRVFPDEMENDPNIFFHGTALENFEGIVLKGFILEPPLVSVSYAKTSAGAIQYAATHENGIIIAVQFENMNAPGLVIGPYIAHTFIDPSSGKREEPTIIGVCKIPCEYIHR